MNLRFVDLRFMITDYNFVVVAGIQFHKGQKHRDAVRNM